MFEKYTCLIYACMTGRPKVIRALLAKGADPNLTDYLGASGLAYAAVNGNLECAKLMHAAGADVNHRNQWGDTCLDRAIQYKRQEIGEFLRSKGGECSEAYEYPKKWKK
jgi:uncharacterized protein